MAAEDHSAERVDKRRVAAAFSAAAPGYDARAVLQATVGERLLERLDLMRIEPLRILDAGAGTGPAARALERRYRRARVVALDLAAGMLAEARRGRRRFASRQSFVCADVEALPLGPQSIDLLFSNLTLQWCNDLDAAFTEFRRVLRPGGLLLFSSFGPDTLRELRAAWRSIDARPHVGEFIDMHDVGDALVRAGFSGPVLDVEHFTLTYADLRAVLDDIRAIGAGNAATERSRALTGKQHWQRFAAAYEEQRRDGRLPATYEVVYAHAWAPVPGIRPQDGSTVAAFPVEHLRGSRRS